MPTSMPNMSWKPLAAVVCGAAAVLVMLMLLVKLGIHRCRNHLQEGFKMMVTKTRVFFC